MDTRQEIVQIVNKLPDEKLSDLLKYLRLVEKASKDEIQLSMYLNTILAEDKEVLEKLAKW